MSTAVVDNFADLKANALNPDIDLIYLAQDITIGIGGILLTKNKPSLVIDGFYLGIKHRIIDHLSNAHSDSIRVDSTLATFELTLQNCIFVGKNFYGAISCENNSNNSAVVLNMIDVEYSGPQASYHRYGHINVYGGDYKIGRYNGTTAATNETFEVGSITFFGEVNIYHDGPENSCIWLCGATPTLTLAQNAIVNVETIDRELIYNDGGAVSILLSQGSRLYMNTHRGMFFSAGMLARSLVLQNGAELIIEQKARQSGVATIQCSGNLTLNPDSRLIIFRKFTASEPLILFTTTATANFINPKSVVLYNSGGRVISWSGGTGTIQIDAQMVRYWNSASSLSIAGTFDDQPLYHWQKADNTNVEIEARVSTSSTTSVTTNMIAGVDAPIIPNTSSFSVYACRVLAVGSLPLQVNPILQNSTNVTGTTDGEAIVRVSTAVATTDSQALATGFYSVPLVVPMAKDIIATVSANRDFKVVSTNVLSEGVLEILFMPNSLPFKRVAVPVRKSIDLRKNSDWSITVRDSRDNGSTWYLYAQAPLPLSFADVQLPEDTMVFVDDSVRSIKQQVLVYVGEGNTDPDYTDTDISWNEIKGILLSFDLDEEYIGGTYSTELFFTLSDEPLD